MKRRGNLANDLGNDAAAVGANPDDNDPVDDSGPALGGGLVAATDDPELDLGLMTAANAAAAASLPDATGKPTAGVLTRPPRTDETAD